MENTKNLEETDKLVADVIKKDLARQQNKINLIASENYASRAILAAQGSILNNKYAEGYPDHRYYGGCQYVDELEKIAIKRAKELFNCEHANVQPHSGTQANMAVYFSVLKPEDKILSMDLSHGGHLSHGSSVNFSGKLYDVSFYGVDLDTETINYDKLMEQAKKVQPDIIVCGASAYPRIIDFKRFREIADEVGAYLLADIAHIAGLIAAGEDVHPSPVPYADFVTMTTQKTLRGARGGIVLCKEEFAQKIDRAVFPGMQGGPLMMNIAGKAVTLKEASTDEYKLYAKQIVKNAKTVADKLTELGFRIVSGGTDNHLMLVNLTNKDMTGKEAEQKLEASGIILNKNTIPGETRSPFVTSGIRIGTPSVTTRGMKEQEMEQIAKLIHDVLINDAKVSESVKKLCDKFPIYEGLM